MAKLYGIGVGPGDPELLTLKAHRILCMADVIFCPVKKAGAESIAFDIIKGFTAQLQAEIVPLVYPMHYHGEQLRKMWEQNANEMASYLTGERIGVFITLGDPSVYSTFMYTLPYVEEKGIAIEVIPGIPSFCAVAASMKMPLMAWDEDLIIAPVRKNSMGNLDEILQKHDNIVLMKPSADKQALVEAIRKNHLENNFVLITKSGTEEERQITDFAELEEYEIPYLSTVIIKKQGVSDYDCM